MSRLPIALFSCVMIPILTVLAYIRWAKVIRQELPHNGVGLTHFTKIEFAQPIYTIAINPVISTDPASTT